MATVHELSAPYANFMLSPRRGPGVCRTCFNLTGGYDRCYACDHGGDTLDVVLPISYSIGGEQLHHALASYKRTNAGWAAPFVGQLAAVLWRFLARHERCLAQAAGIEDFDLVTTVPSGDPERDQGNSHPLQRIVGQLVTPTRGRHSRVLRRTDAPTVPHRLSVDRFAALHDLGGRRVMLIDDTWTSGANAQSAAVTLKRAGATTVAAVVIGRHLNREWGENDARLRRLASPFDWTTCALCAIPSAEPSDATSPAAATPRSLSATRR